LSTTESVEPLTEQWVRNTLRRYTELDERADHVAAIVYATRFNGSKTDYFKHEYDYGSSYGEYVQSEFHFRSNDDYIQWPLDLLWADDETIVRRTQEKIADEKAKAEAKAAQQKVEEEENARRTYEHLKRRFEPADANTP